MSLKLVLVLTVLSLVYDGGVLAGRGKYKGCRRRGHRVRGREDVTGRYFQWGMTGQDNDGLSLTYQEGAYAPDNSTSIKLFPKDRSQRALGLVPSKILYDFSSSDPMVAIRFGKYGRGSCILTDADVSSYDNMINELRSRNGSTEDVPDESERLSLVASLVTDPSQIPQPLRDFCSKDKCGRSKQAVFYSTEIAEVDEDDEEADEGDDDNDNAVEFEPDVVLLNSRISVSGLPAPRRHGHRHGGRRSHRRQHGLPSWEARRHEWRQNRRGGRPTDDADSETRGESRRNRGGE